MKPKNRDFLVSGTAGSRAPDNVLRSLFLPIQLNNPGGKTSTFSTLPAKSLGKTALWVTWLPRTNRCDLGDEVSDWPGQDPTSTPRTEGGSSNGLSLSLKWAFLLKSRMQATQACTWIYPPQPVERVHSSLSYPDGERERPREGQLQAPCHRACQRQGWDQTRVCCVTLHKSYHLSNFSPFVFGDDTCFTG